MPDINSLDEFLYGKPEAHPMIYAYTDELYPGLLKVGYTAIDVDARVAQQYPTRRPDGSVPYRIVLRESAMYSDGGSFSDHDVHRLLRQMGVENPGGEWFRCDVDKVKAAVVAIRNRTTPKALDRTNDFSMRPEQEQAVNQTMAYFRSAYQAGSRKTPKFLWNAKMRFGKTFASYELARKMGLKRVLILTFKPAVKTAWRDDLLTHKNYVGWQFITRPENPGEPDINQQYLAADKSKPIVCFGSFQDFLGYNKATNGYKPQHEWVRAINWDLVIFDEYHFGAWKENAKAMFAYDEDTYEEDLSNYSQSDAANENELPITTDYYLYLSGTPFRALRLGEFVEDQLFTWTYSDEQKAKEEWPKLSRFPDYVPKPGEKNPYAALPRMVMLTYKIPESIQRIAKETDQDEFGLNVFFKAEGKGDEAHFVNEEYVQKWLDLIRGAYNETTVDELRMGAKKPPMPFSDVTLRSELLHTVWFMPSVASCFAMRNLLAKPHNTFYHDYTVNVCAGIGAGIGASALDPVMESMGDPLTNKTITLTCGKLMTGVTVKPWSGILMLRDLSSPETYFQAAFRVQSPWEIEGENGTKEVMKHDCYVFDFALNRALKQIQEYSCELNTGERSPERKVAEFIRFLPVLAYEGSHMERFDAGKILDFAMSGTTATLLAKRWQAAILVNVDNDTLRRLMANEQAMAALNKIEAFRNLNKDIPAIINRSEAIKNIKKESDKLTPKKKKELDDEQKEIKNKRKEIRNQLLKFAARIPIFMFLTDYREETLQDVITEIEPNLFRKVTGLDVQDFDLLCSLNVFNATTMNDAVYKFWRYEESSLNYTGINKHAGEKVGLYSTVLSREEYEAMKNVGTREEYDHYADELAASMIAAIPADDDIPDKPFEVEPEDEDDFVPEPVAEKPRKTRIGNNIVERYQDVTIITPRRAEPTPAPAPAPATPQPSPVDIELPEIHVGTVVKHRFFGKGTITEINEATNRLYVRFGDQVKPFQLTMAFAKGMLVVEE